MQQDFESVTRTSVSMESSQHDGAAIVYTFLANLVGNSQMWPRLKTPHLIARLEDGVSEDNQEQRAALQPTAYKFRPNHFIVSVLLERINSHAKLLWVPDPSRSLPSLCLCCFCLPLLLAAIV